MTARSGNRPRPTDGVVLSARLDLPDGDLDVEARAIVRLPDDDEYVAALVGPGEGLGSGDGTSAPGGRSRHAVSLDGRRLGRASRDERVRAGLVGIGGAPVAPDVSVVDHLAAVCGSAAAEQRLAATPHLAGRGHDPAGVLSGGERMVLDWLIADALRPLAVVLDRPATGLDAEALAWAHSLLDAWLDRGVAALLRVGRDDEARWLTHRADGSPR